MWKHITLSLSYSTVPELKRPWRRLLMGPFECACFNKPRSPDERLFFIFTPLNKFNNNHVCRDAGRCQKRLQTCLLLLLSFGVWRRRQKLISLSYGAEPPTYPAESRRDLFCLCYSVICNSVKSRNVVRPAFYSIPALPLAWFNTVVLIYALCLLSAAPSWERIYLPGILKTDFTEPSTSI